MDLKVGLLLLLCIFVLIIVPVFVVLGTLVRDIECTTRSTNNSTERVQQHRRFLFAVCSPDTYIRRTAMETPVVFDLTPLPCALVLGTAYVAHRTHRQQIIDRSSILTC